MYINIGPFRSELIPTNRWITQLEDKFGLVGNGENVPLPKWYHKAILEPLHAFDSLVWRINELYASRKRRITIHIDKYDTWSMDHTLAMIIHPMLIQLKETKHGAPNTDDWDVPHGIKSVNAKPKENDGDTDEFHFVRWDFIMDEMIHAFGQLKEDDWQAKFYYDESGSFNVDEKGLDEEDKRIHNGLRLFGKYFRNLWD